MAPIATAEYLDARRRLAEAVNAGIKLSVRWHVVRRVDRATSVRHIQLEEGLYSGRLRRKSGDLLCGATSDGVAIAEARDGSGQTYAQEVSCKACLARAQVLSNLIYLPQY